ncbi:transposase [Rhodocytophaga aerolata]|uniref:Transposase n=1 Tax=Rhodocytophaga aerolata TaxID=455078 RepID=A0ABT8RAP7_9BACT|nr:transposase [Rhodocytophaga aerolata]MDO1449176.1 transposase [Rhodocytophaga aerolata]
MNKKDKRKFTAAYKVKVAMEALKGQATIAEIAKSHQIHPSQIMDWKKIVLERSEELFSTQGKKIVLPLEDTSSLYEQIGRLQMEVSFLKKKLG